MSLSTLLLLSLSLLLVYFLTKILSRPKCTVPSGPRGHWLMGHSLLPIERLTPSLLEWSKDYGSVFKFSLFPFLPPDFVIVNDLDTAKRFLSDKTFAGRDESDSTFRRYLNPSLSGVANQSISAAWRDLHKFVTSTLSSMGFGRSRMEAAVLSEADALVDAVLGRRGKPFAPDGLLRVAVSNVITNVVFGERAEIGGPSRLHDSLKTIANGFLYLITHPLYAFFPSVAKLIRTSRFNDIVDSYEFVCGFIQDSLKRHEATVDPEDPRDFLDAIVLERRANPGAEHLSDDNLHHTVFDLFLGGTDTTTHVLDWIIAWFVKFPEIRRRLLDEVHQAFGQDGAPVLSALSSMHYFQAFVDEVLRRSSVADFAAPHTAVKEGATFDGYEIPRGTQIMVNIYACHHDPTVWDDPKDFRPERFLDAEGRYVKSDELLSFGFGTRRCIGEKLARLEIFVFVVRLLQRVEFRLAEGSEMPAMEGRKPFLRAPENYEVVATALG